MFENYRDKWWKYMDCINDECSKITELEVCSQKCEELVEVTELKQAFDDSFTAS